VGAQQGPAGGPQFAQPALVGLVDRFGLGKAGHRTLDAGFTQQVQRGVGRAIGGVGYVVGAGAGKLVARVEAGDLQRAVQPHFDQQRVGLGQEVVVVQEVLQHRRVHQQRGLEFIDGRVGHPLQLGAQRGEQRSGVERVAAHIAHQALDLHRLGKGAQIQADHRVFDPRARGL
jgi:hypothetical protein